MTSAPTLETPRLVLRGRRADDFPAFAQLQADPHFQRYINGAPYGEQEAWSKFCFMAGSWSLHGYGFFLVEEKASGEYVGDAGVAEFHRAIDPSHVGVPEAGWGFAPRTWGTGIAGEAVAAALAWFDRAFDHPQTCCIIAAENHASARLAQRNGFRPSYIARFKGEPIDVFRRPRGG